MTKFVKLSNSNHQIASRVWKNLCQRFGWPVDQIPKYISNGAEQTVYEFGEKYVLKLSDRGFIIKTAKKLRGKKIPMVARCFAVVKAQPESTSNSFHCIVTERCKDAESADKYSVFSNLQSLTGKNSKYTPDMLIAAAKLQTLGIDYLCDLHGANMMHNSEGVMVLSDYGCLRF